MSPPTAAPSPTPDDQDPADGREEDATDEAGLPGDERRGIGEWAIVLVLVALIVGVAWSQFGPLFETGTGGSDGAPAQGLTVEGEGVVVGGTAMSQLVDPGPGAEPGGAARGADADRASDRPADAPTESAAEGTADE